MTFIPTSAARPRRSPGRRVLRRRVRDERGDITTTTLIFPALLFVILLAVQFALAYHAKNVVTAAAQDAARVAQGERGTMDAARAEGEGFVAANASRLLDDVMVVVDGDDDAVRVEVRGRVTSVVPGLNLRVRGVASGPRERFRAEADR